MTAALSQPPTIMPNPAGASPALAQWFAAKAAHPDALIFFRMGDFYELFFGDAEAAAAALAIALTARGSHDGAPVPMCGVPVASAESYLARLIRAGFRVAIAEQMEDPRAKRAAKTPIDRAVVRLVTPGTLLEEGLLDATRPNRLLALAAGDETRDDVLLGAAWLDISTGDFRTSAVPSADLPALLAALDPAEILAAPGIALGDWAARRAPEDAAPPPPAAARDAIATSFAVASLDAFGHFSDLEAMAAALALAYVRRTQAGALPHLAPPAPQGQRGTMLIDAATRASLEILRARDGGTKHTLFAAVQRTATAAGGRLLAEWLAAPLTDAAAIIARQESWAWLLATPRLAERLRGAIRGAPDLARALARLSLGRAAPRDLAAVRDALAAARAAATLLDEAGRDGEAATPPPLLEAVRAALRPAPDLAARLAQALAESLPARLEEGGVIAPGFDAALDEARRLRDETRQVIAALQHDLATRYGVSSLKIRHHAQLGYVIEVAAAAVAKLTDHPDLIMRQGMANGARFTSSELADLDRRINEAAARAMARERELFAALVAETCQIAEALAACAGALARLDVLLGAAALAAGGGWCRPVIREDSAFRVTAGRHPVVEAALAGKARFVPNDCDLSPERRVLLLTGPNMAGKSTYLRQNALAAILAQAGLPVPAASAEIGIVDKLFSRVGGADDLARGQSTFMVEMTETAAILRQAGPHSLIVIDEIGRGTATLDGLAIAWAVLEALHTEIRARCIFATHFHELARLTAELPRLSPHTMRVVEHKGSVVFLHEVIAGVAGRSWGVHVARLAGVPASVVRRAGDVLAALERRAAGLTTDAELPLFAAAENAKAETAHPPPPLSPVLSALTAIDPDQLSPKEALETLYRMREILADAALSEGI
ncbi:MAG: DNA mismatch repair protein MutS [Acidibrevibacterium sp.]|jgi:DNA mismatch repair protein MutS|uniref:DNA mismatch repair protein MutS n=1 Tax=Acidibrevibacterium fodinaquatile TaxID=1969806 RepID=UPI0023A80093|nr:DNA mismatch repair protein MutS [Acidibrevibacterium fodinaquatile]MCA7117913.1 DNA mismatch repair protein MutS [Acidibrevibacterium fodinaquatile]